MNARIRKKHRMINGETYHKLYWNRKPIKPREWILLIRRLRTNVDSIPRKRNHSLYKWWRRKYYWTYEQQHEMWVDMLNNLVDVYKEKYHGK